MKIRVGLKDVTDYCDYMSAVKFTFAEKNRCYGFRSDVIQMNRSFCTKPPQYMQQNFQTH